MRISMSSQLCRRSAVVCAVLVLHAYLHSYVRVTIRTRIRICIIIFCIRIYSLAKMLTLYNILRSAPQTKVARFSDFGNSKLRLRPRVMRTNVGTERNYILVAYAAIPNYNVRVILRSCYFLFFVSNAGVPAYILYFSDIISFR